MLQRNRDELSRLPDILVDVNFGGLSWLFRLI